MKPAPGTIKLSSAIDPISTEAFAGLREVRESTCDCGENVEQPDKLHNANRTPEIPSFDLNPNQYSQFIPSPHKRLPVMPAS
jgi:hypothetical protein